MTQDEMVAAIEADAALDEAFNVAEYEGKAEGHRQGWKSWEWCLNQLLAKGMPQEHAEAFRDFWMMKAQRIGYLEAIHKCVFGQSGTASLIM